MARKQARKAVLSKERVFLLPQGGERIELLQLRVDEAWMTHHHAAVWQPVEKVWKGRSKVRLVSERVGAGEGRIGAHAKRGGTAAEATAEDVEKKALAIVESMTAWKCAPALAHPCGRRLASGDCEQRVAHLWKQLHMLVAVNEVGRAAEVICEDSAPAARSP